MKSNLYNELKERRGITDLELYALAVFMSIMLIGGAYVLRGLERLEALSVNACLIP